MEKLKVLQFIFLVLVFCPLMAQKKNTVNLGYGLNSGLLKDHNFSLLHYREFSSIYALKYSRHNPKNKNVYETEINFSSGKVKNSISELLTSNFIYAKIGTSYLREIKISKNEKWKYLVGAGYKTNLFYFQWDDNEAFSFVASHGFTLNFKTQFQINERNNINSTLEIPFMQILARPPYNGRDEFIIENENSPAKIFFHGKLVTFNKYYGFCLNTNYNFNITKCLDFALNYNLNYQKVTGINKLIHLQNQLNIGLNFNF